MDIRTILIIIALIMPLVVLGVLTQRNTEPPPPPPDAAAAAKPPAPKPTPGGRAASSVPNKLPPTTGAPAAAVPPAPAAVGLPANKQEALARLKKRMANIESMSDEQWAEEMKRLEEAQKTWMPLLPTPEEQKAVAPVARQPDVPGAPAAPMNDNMGK